MSGGHTASHGLPASPTPLIGRESDLREAAQQLLRPEVRLLTLTGPAGTGKTRLALALAEQVRGNFEDGVRFVDLTRLADPALVGPAVAAALELRVTSRRPLPAALALWLKTRTLLLVLDNFEHVLAAAPLVGELLAAAPGLTVLAASREALRLRWEHERPVPPLALPGLHPLPPLPALAAIPAVALFLERAAAVSRETALTKDNARVVAQICHRLDGLPLALELAAARTKALPFPALLGRLQRRLGLLTRGARDLPPRHETLRAAVDWSYRLLDANERALFRRLGTCVGGCDAAAAAALWGEAVPAAPTAAAEAAPAVLDLLASLVDKNLLRLQANTDAGAEPRYVMLETIREFAQERLAAEGETETADRRHAEHFLAAAESAEPHLRRPDPARWLDLLEAEHANIRRALEWWLARGRGGSAEAAAAAARLGAALWRFWWVRGHALEGRRWLDQILALSIGPTPARAEAAFGAGVLAEFAGDLAAARTRFEECLAFYRDSGDEEGAGYVHTLLAEVTWQEGDLAAARADLEASVAVFRRLGDARGLAWALPSLGLLLDEEGDPTAGRRTLEESVTLFRQLDERIGLAQALSVLAIVLDHLHEAAAARTVLAESLIIQRELGDRTNSVFTLEAAAALAAAESAGARPDRPAAERTVRLAGAAAALREATSTRTFVLPSAQLARRLATLREILGEAAYAGARAEGTAMPLAAALDAALAWAAPAPASPARTVAGGPGAPLTPREQEVAALVAQGLTNREIAARLIITEGTAGVHVTHILDRLGLRSRAQIAAWATGRGLVPG